MSFSGKKFKRVSCDNLDEFVRETNTNDNVVQVLKCDSTIFAFNRIDENVFEFSLIFGDQIVSHPFTLGEEYETTRKDGTEVKITYSLESDDVLIQRIEQSDGNVSYFRREFGENEAKLIITMEGSDSTATVYYEQVD